MPPKSIITFQTERNFRLRLTLATLSGKSIKIEKIRSNDLNPGLRDYEVSFLRLLESITNGSKIEISYTGTTIVYHPGLITGGENITHTCSKDKPIGYFLEYMLFLAPFSKKKFKILFRGATSSKEDLGIDGIRLGLFPIMEKFGVRETSLTTLKKGSPPLGDGEVQLIVDSLIPQPLTLHALDPPKVNAVRGIAYSTRVSPSIVNRMIDSARGVLKNIGCEVNITADAWRGDKSGKSPGFGITLVAETKKGWRFYTEDIGLAGEVPEDVGERVALNLIEEISKSAVVGSNQLKLSLVYMVIGKEDVGRLRISKKQIDEDFIELLRDIKKVFGVEVYFGDCDDSDDDFILSVKGIGFTNTNKKIA